MRPDAKGDPKTPDNSRVALGAKQGACEEPSPSHPLDNSRFLR
jgi:hypothetical protein